MAETCKASDKIVYWMCHEANVFCFMIFLVLIVLLLEVCHEIVSISLV